MTQTRTVGSVAGVDHTIVEWEAIVTGVIRAMRSNLEVYKKTQPAMVAATKFKQHRMFFFRGAHQTGKSTGIVEYMRKNNQCMLFDEITGTSYILNDGSSNEVLKISGRYQTLKSAFESACKNGVETFFISSFDEAIIKKMTAVYVELESIVPEKMIVVIEN